MTADGDPVSSSRENGVSPHITWIELRTLWERLWQAGLLSRFVLHGCFLAMLLAGIWLSKAVIFPQQLFSLPTLAAQMAVEGKRTSLGVVYASLGLVSPGGIGGEEADVLVSAVVPHTTIPRRYRIDPITYTVEPGD
ncbi:MAG: hypothetical protein H5T63_02800, partial [Chloroflexi bacterium]|nr:hypothetical protein [Chloroflexota bacterium]